MVVYVGKTTDKNTSAYEIGLSDVAWDPHQGFRTGRLFGWREPFSSDEFERKTGIILRRGEVCRAKLCITGEGFQTVPCEGSARFA